MVAAAGLDGNRDCRLVTAMAFFDLVFARSPAFDRSRICFGRCNSESGLVNRCLRMVCG